MKSEYIKPKTEAYIMDTSSILASSPGREENPYWHDTHEGHPEDHGGYWQDHGGWGEWGKP